MAILQCPNCGSTDIKDLKKQSKGIGGGIGAALGAVAFGPLGLAAGAFLGSKLGNNHEQMADKKGRNYNYFQCKQCGRLFLICPECRRTVGFDHLLTPDGKIWNHNNQTQDMLCGYCGTIFLDDDM